MKSERLEPNDTDTYGTLFDNGELDIQLIGDYVTLKQLYKDVLHNIPVATKVP